MTKKEAIEDFNLSIIDNADEKGKLSQTCCKYIAEDILNDIYNDFESQICVNCKFYTKCNDGFNYCDKNSFLNGFINDSFGCNNFERK